MTNDEFRCWRDWHTIRYPGLTEWAQKLPDANATWNLWKKVLFSVTQREAEAASDTLYALDQDRQPKGYADHPRAILAIVRSTRRDKGESRFREGGWVTAPTGERVWAYACPHCEDAKSGTVNIWTPAALKCYESNPDQFNPIPAGHPLHGGGWCYHHVVIRCCCERGQQGRDHIPHVFDPAVHARRFIPPGERTTFLDSLFMGPKPAELFT